MTVDKISGETPILLPCARVETVKILDKEKCCIGINSET